jgi:hypothetical protein
MAYATALLHPPMRLRALPERTTKWLRTTWTVLFGLAIVCVLVSAVYAIRANYWTQPVIAQFQLDFFVATDGELLVGTRPGREPSVPVTAKVIAVDEKAVSPDLTVAGFARLLDDAEGRPVAVTLRLPDGKTQVLTQRRGPIGATPAALRARDIRFGARLVSGLLACAAMLACSLLLALRRPDDPVAMLLAFAFAGLAATIDPPLQFWLWTDRDFVLDILGAGLFYCLLVALSAFPDGVFVPRLLRWLLPLGIPLAFIVSIPNIDEDIQGILAIVLLLAVLGGQVVRFRREPPGIARQQIKWAGFGFAAGFALILAAVILAAAMGDDPSQYTALMSLAILLLFSCGMAVIALGLIIALLRFRLWEADTVITRSAAYAVVTLVVGVVWAASSDILKLVITEVIGRESDAGATTIGAIIAAGVLSPTQSVVLGWTRRRFGGALDQIRGAAKRLKTWGLTETPEELATRALAIIDSAVHPKASAIVLDTAMGAELIAARNVTSASDPRLVERIVLADEETSVGTLLVGRRSDGKRYNRQELDAIEEIVPSLAAALRVSRGRYSRESLMQQQLDEMAARLKQLEGGAAKPA